MPTLGSTIDGCRVVMGSWVTHLAMLATMVIFIRKPTVYPDEERNRDSYFLFVWLCLMHFFMAVVKFHTLYYSPAMWWTISTCMLVICATINYICQYWLFETEYYGEITETGEKSPSVDQKQFETWLWIEYGVFWSTIFTSFIYSLSSFLSKPKIVFTTPIVKENAQYDFIETHAVQLDFLISIWAPGMVSLLVGMAD